ncbi:MAG: hypothetical protein LQ352_008111 [Teloschistes flavicans]|nr:MAG: hypothetical protein LQ352_008111 [Teloschistes flavicans]
MPRRGPSRYPGQDYVEEPIWFTTREAQHISYLYMTDQRTLDYIAYFIFWYQFQAFLHNQNRKFDFGYLRSSISYWDVWRMIVRTRRSADKDSGISKTPDYPPERDPLFAKVVDHINNRRAVSNYFDTYINNEKDSGNRDREATYRNLKTRFNHLSGKMLERTEAIGDYHRATTLKGCPPIPDKDATVKKIAEYCYKTGAERGVSIRNPWVTEELPPQSYPSTSGPSTSGTLASHRSQLDAHRTGEHYSQFSQPESFNTPAPIDSNAQSHVSLTPGYFSSYAQPAPFNTPPTFDTNAQSYAYPYTEYTPYTQTPYQSAQPISGYDQPIPGYEQPISGYDQPIPGYDQPIPGYDQPIPGYEQPISGYDQPIPGYDQPIPGYDQPTQDYTQQSSQYLTSSNIVSNPTDYLGPQPTGAFDSYENPARDSRQPSSSAARSSGAAHKSDSKKRSQGPSGQSSGSAKHSSGEAHKDESKKRSKGASGQPSSSASRSSGTARKSDKEKASQRSHGLGSPKGRKRHH